MPVHFKMDEILHFRFRERKFWRVLNTRWLGFQSIILSFEHLIRDVVLIFLAFDTCIFLSENRKGREGSCVVFSKKRSKDSCVIPGRSIDFCDREKSLKTVSEYWFNFVTFCYRF